MLWCWVLSFMWLFHVFSGCVFVVGVCVFRVFVVVVVLGCGCKLVFRGVCLCFVFAVVI